MSVWELGCGMSYRLWRMLHRSLYIIANTRHAAGQARQYPLYSAFRAQLVPDFRLPSAPEGVRRGEPSPEMCFTHRDDAITWLLDLELATAP